VVFVEERGQVRPANEQEREQLVTFRPMEDA